MYNKILVLTLCNICAENIYVNRTSKIGGVGTTSVSLEKEVESNDVMGAFTLINVSPIIVFGGEICFKSSALAMHLGL